MATRLDDVIAYEEIRDTLAAIWMDEAAAVESGK
jgi:hypothetical protein